MHLCNVNLHRFQYSHSSGNWSTMSPQEARDEMLAGGEGGGGGLYINAGVARGAGGGGIMLDLGGEG